jgi:hypothetical protein
MSVLSAADITQFIERGWCVVRGAFTAEQARAARAVVWQRMEQKAGIRESDPSTWPPAYDIEEILMQPEVISCFTDRLADAVGELLGPDRWTGERRWGFWPVNFHFGADAPTRWPEWGWHVDGNWFRHTVDARYQGLLLIGLFSDVAEGGGGTVVASGSHRRTARVLAAHPDGLTHTDLFKLVLSTPIGDFSELTGAAGDAVLGHPFLFHARGHKRSGPPRFISNTETPLRAPLQLERSDGNYSVLEGSIRAALAHPPPPVAVDGIVCRF